MGSWAVDSFGNDAACDWAYELEEASDGIGFIAETFDRAVDQAAAGYLEGPTGDEVIAACEVLAMLKGRLLESNSYTETAIKWVQSNAIVPSSQIIAKANGVLDLVTSEKSESYELWKDSECFDEWQISVNDLRARLNS